MYRPRIAVALLIAALPTAIAIAQDEPAEREPVEVTIGERGSEQDPLSGRQPTVSVDAQRAPQINQVEGVLGVPALTVKVDPRVLGVVPGEPLPRLRREGEALRKRDGRLMPTGDRGYAVFVADADPAAGDDEPLAMVVAPCMTLESMERLLEDRGEALRFTITGQVHTYRGVNYLLPTSQPKPWLVAEQPENGVVGELETSEQSVEQAAEKDTEAEADVADVADEATQEVARDDSGTPKGADPDKRPPTADEVLNDLLEQRSAPPMEIDAPEGDGIDGLPPAQGTKNLADPLLLGLDPDQPQAELKDEGEFIIARTGRLIRSADGSQSLFVLDADKSSAPEPPLIMHACKLLETMESTVMEQGDDVPFVVTGQVYVYRGANYLLPTIVKREFDRGNLE